MRLLLIALTTFFALGSTAQISNPEEADKFWSDNIQAILEMDEVKILAQTNYPLDYGGEELNEAKFKALLPVLFNENLIKEVGQMSVGSIDAWIMSGDDSDTYMLVFYSVPVGYDAMVFLFKQFNGKWKLYSIDLQTD